MGERTGIAWTDSTFNPWIGCTMVSPACSNCYAEQAPPTRKHQVQWGPGRPRHLTHQDTWRKPRRWNREAEAAGVRRKVFCLSLGDWLDPEVPVEWLSNLLELIGETPWLDWQLLTKRPELWKERLEAVVAYGDTKTSRWADKPAAVMARMWLSGMRIPPNVWVGCTVEDQRRADERIPLLLRIPALVWFLSMEPLLERVDLTPWIGYTRRHEVETHGNHGSQGSAGGDFHHSPRRHDLARGEEGGTPDIVRVSSGPLDAEPEAVARLGAPVSLASLQRADSWRFDDKPQERGQGGQSAGELGVSDALGAIRARNARPSARAPGPEWGAQRHVETDDDGRRRDSTETGERREFAGDRKGLLDLGPDSEQDRSRGTLGISWTIVGGESGDKARPFHLGWARGIVNQCEAAGVPVFVKQMGDFAVTDRENAAGLRLAQLDPKNYEGLGDDLVHVTFDAHNGADPAEWPEDLRVRQFPTV